jgi:hypothetical protein
MSNKINWVEYNKISNKSDAFKQAKNIDPSLSDALENLSSATGMKGKALPTDRYTAGNTQDPDEIFSLEDANVLSTSRVSRRYSPLKTDEYSGNRPADPTFLNFKRKEAGEESIPVFNPPKPKTVEEVEIVSRKVDVKVEKHSMADQSQAMAMDPKAAAFASFFNKDDINVKLAKIVIKKTAKPNKDKSFNKTINITTLNPNTKNVKNIENEYIDNSSNKVENNNQSSETVQIIQ